MNAHYGEDKIRGLFQSYAQHIFDIAFCDAVFITDEARLAQEKVHEPRILAWKSTESYKIYSKVHIFF